MHRGKISSCGVHVTKSMCPINFMHLFEASAITCNRMHNMHFNWNTYAFANKLCALIKMHG